MENLLTAKGLSDKAALLARKEAWVEAYRHTPHGKPGELLNRSKQLELLVEKSATRKRTLVSIWRSIANRTHLTLHRLLVRSAIISLVCGRYRLSRRKQIIEEHFECVSGDEDWSPRYNVAPTQPVPIIRQHPKEPRRELSLVRWGLIPWWAKDASGAAKMINARSETAATLPAFRDALKTRRCVVPADGFYEWLRSGKEKQPYCFEVNDGELFAFAGLWERWKHPSGDWIKTCAILTTTPNAVTAQVHDRMPVILHPDTYDLWLDPGFTNVTAVSAMLKPYDALTMRSYPVSTRINHAANDDPECSAPVTAESPSQGQLF